ncbi:IS3 family transposase [Leucobacter insecticola]|uniref:IS3 family transposase n=1 Tax=Leucobacter insecticola TaxID=2714934 RepID=A0A6G8FKN6_9MICO|nr:IS3 family transposase [Leucobacter insecticola]QIM16927.1 IS3 family transposase [Leucobacter insecticola]
MARKYDQEFRARALRMLAEALPEQTSLHAASQHVGGLLGVSPDTLRIWYRRTQIDTGVRPGITTDVAEENRRLRRENAELKKANEVLKAASIFFAKGTRPATNEMIKFIDTYRDRFGVEFLCRTLRAAVRGFITSRGYRAAKRRLPSARQLRDELLVPEIRRLHEANYGVYGVRKMHALVKREGWEIGRDQTARLMRLADVQGVTRRAKAFTTRSDSARDLPGDLVNRAFTAAAPRCLWVADITYVATWSGFAYVAFITDVYARKIVGWSVASTLKTEALPLQALDMAAWNIGGNLAGVTHHSDHGSNYMSLRYTERVRELGAMPSTGTVGDSYDNALAETVNGLYKAELIRRRGPWKTVEEVELATLEYVWWWNNQRLHEALEYRTPVEVEAAYYAGARQPVTTRV